MLVSWAVPKGPTLDPTARRLAVHVEDHPLDYYDFEGVIAAGEYGGGDVIVWDWGTWELVEGDDPLAAIAAGDLHLDARRRQAARPLRARAHPGRRARVAALQEARRRRGRRLGPRGTPPLGEVRADERRGQGSPSASWTGHANWAPATPDELAALDALGGRRLAPRRAHPAPDQPRQGPFVVPGRPVTKRDLIRHNATAAPVMLPSRRSSRNLLPPYLDKAPHAPESAPVAQRGGRPGRAPSTGADRRGRTTAVDEPCSPSATAGRSSTGRRFDDVVVLARLHRTALDHLGVGGGRDRERGTRDPDLDPGGRRVHVRRPRAWVEQLSRAVGRNGPATPAAATVSSHNAADSTRWISAVRSRRSPLQVRPCPCRSGGTS